MTGSRSAPADRPPPEPLGLLRILERAAAAANQSSTLEEAAEAVLAAVCAYTGWPLGHLYVASGNGDGVLLPSTTWYSADPERFRSFRQVAESTPMPPGVGLPGRVQATRRPTWITDVGHDPDAGAAAGIAGEASGLDGPLGAAFGFPVLVGGDVAAVLEFFAEEAIPPDDSLLDAMAVVGRHLSRLVERNLERAALERQLAERTLHDPLTGLPNRALRVDRLEHAMARASRRETLMTVLCLDIDRFKAINDGYGHDAGDELLQAVAARLRSVLSPGDTVARFGGDEFAVLCEEVSDRAGAEAVAEHIEKAMATPFAVRGQELTVTATVGVAVSRLAAMRPDQLLRDAEVALEQARQRAPGSHVFYEESMRVEVAARLAAEHDLRHALRDNQLRLHYQPIVDLTTGGISGVEALVRWQHPSRGLLPPQQFVTMAEETGLIVPLGRWVLEQACRQGAAWQRVMGPGARLRVSVNVSARQFQQPHWADEVARALLGSGFAPSQLVLEITESVLMDDTDTTSLRLAELRALGVGIAIDDFGTGYSSLGYLRRFPVDILKVDKSFIDGVAEGPHESALARAVIKLAATLKMDAVAEGVSSRRQVMTLRRLRCRYAQGYYFARPQPAEAIEGLLSSPAELGANANGLADWRPEPEPGTVPAEPGGRA